MEPSTLRDSEIQFALWSTSVYKSESVGYVTTGKIGTNLGWCCQDLECHIDYVAVFCGVKVSNAALKNKSQILTPTLWSYMTVEDIYARCC